MVFAHSTEEFTLPGKVKFYWIYVLFHCIPLRELARKAGQKDGPKGHWDIVAFNTYEEAFSYMVGYEYPEMKDLIAVIDVVNAYCSGNYRFPSFYFIPTNIPPKSLHPPAPRHVLPWVTKHSPNFASTPSFKTHRSHTFKASVPGHDINLNISLNGLSLSPSPETPRGTTTNRGSSIASFNDSSPTRLKRPVKSPSSTGYQSTSTRQQKYGPIITLTRPMREFLRLFFGFTRHDIEELSEILKVPSQHATLYPTLREKGMADEEIEFLTNWAFGSFPDHEKEVGEEDDRRMTEF
jgi:hypothetical protein